MHTSLSRSSTMAPVTRPSSFTVSILSAWPQNIWAPWLSQASLMQSIGTWELLVYCLIETAPG